MKHSIARSLVARSCPACGSHDESHVLAEASFDEAALNAFAFASRKIPEYMHYRLVVCPSCDLAYANPCPSSDSLGDAYEEAAFDSGNEARFAARTYGAALDTFLSKLPDRSGALDIGTGDGAFLEELLQRGFSSVQGVEPSAAPIEAARPQIKPLIKRGIFTENLFPPESFSLVTCFQTIEHVHDPALLCRSVYQSLKPGGCIFFVAHNRRGLLNRILGERSPIFDIEHVQLFSPKSIRSLLERSGFHGCEVSDLWNRYPVSYWMRLVPMPARLKQLTLRQLHASRVGALPIAANVGNMIAYGFKPIR